MKNRWCYFGFITLIAVSTASAQQESKIPPLPEGPLLKRAPDYSIWTVTATGNVEDDKNAASRGDKGNSPSLTASTTTKTGSIILEQVADAQGRKHEIWHVKGLRIEKLPNSEPLIYPDVSGGDIYTPAFSSSDFAGLDWISKDTYSGIQKYQGRDYIVFNGSISPLSSDKAREEQIAMSEALFFNKNSSVEVKRVPTVAYIDLETRLPLMVILGKQKRIYQFGQPPQSQLSLPEDVAHAIASYQAQIQRLARKPPHP
jgi:hypothetical protein